MCVHFAFLNYSLNNGRGAGTVGGSDEVDQGSEHFQLFTLPVRRLALLVEEYFLPQYWLSDELSRPGKLGKFEQCC